MELTWRRWVVALVLILLLFVACDLFAQRYLADWYGLIHPFTLSLNFQALTVYHDTWADFDQSKLDAWYESTARAMTDWIEVPWPIRPTPPVRDLLDTDPATVGTSDPQTLLGLAMLARDPVTMLGLATGDLYSPDLDQRRDAAFRQYVLMALSAADDPEYRRCLDRLVLYLENAMSLHEHAAYWAATIPLMASPRTDTQRALTASELLDVLSHDQARSAQFESQREDYLSARAHTLDPTNMLYIYRQANRHLGEGIIERQSLDSSTDPHLPSEWLGQTWRLTNPESLLPRARQLDAILTTDHVRDAAFHLHKADAREMLCKAIAHHWPQAVPKGLTQFAAADQRFADVGTLSAWRRTVKRLCFLGDRLADRRQDQLALRMYRHANTLGRQLTDGDPNDRTMLDVLVGYACARMVTDHLAEFWSRRGDVDRTWKATRHAAALQRHITDVSRWLHQPTVDPIGRNDDAYRGYTRATGLTWWYAYTAIALTALSIAAALIYLPLRPRKAAATPEPAALPPLAWPIVLAPILAMAWLGLVIPLRLEPMQALVVTLVWAQLLTVVWVMAIGMYATRRSSPDAPARPRRTPVWLGVILTVAVLAAVINGSASGDSAAVIATAAVLALGLVIWLIATVVGVFKNRSPDLRLRQAQAVKAFAITAMVAGLISIAAALVSMPLTWRHQINYFKLSADSLTNEARDCVRQTTPVDPLPDELFSLDPASTSSATP